MKIAARTFGVVLASAAMLAMAWISRAPLTLESGTGAVLRISLGARPERIENCRTQTDEELAKLAPQMRQRVVCDGVTARYQLEVRRNGAVLWSQLMRGGGLRHDRQLYVSRALAVPTGIASFSVSLKRIDTVDARAAAGSSGDVSATERVQRDSGADIMLGRGLREAESRQRRREEAVPAALDLSLDATLAPHEVLLVTYDPELRTLRAVRARQTSGANK
jgi:hypothetical protein